MRRTIAITAVILLVGVATAELRVSGFFPDSLHSRRDILSVPNPEPPVGKNLVRDKYTRLPINTVETPETVRVCAIRVQFQPDSTPTSTGTGQFVLTPDSTQKFDPPPHDRKYFEAHLEALARYYRFVSHGKVIIEYTVFPEEDSAAYTLPDSMGYYGPEGWFGSDLGTRLAGFFTDAIKLADSLDTINWCDYDVVLVFHAGSDWQDDVASFYPDYAEMYPDIFIPSPDDLPTAFVVMPEPVVACVDRGIVMPESPSQDGQTVVLNGVLAHEFGHALGLVDLYSTYDFYPGVGYFSLMDSGHNIGVVLVDDETGDTFYVSGALPAYPMAWERAYLGWEPITTLTEPQDSVPLRACELPLDSAANTIYKINIDEFEYYLLENRKAELWSREDTVAIKQDSLTGVIQGIQVNGEFVGAYDFLLPGSGMLIWHIDERVAYGDYDGNGINNFQDNTLQWDWTHPFIKLVEADGIDDISMRLDEYGFGTDKDYFNWPNNTHFGPETDPKSQSYSGGYTGIDISHISRADTVMWFDFTYVGPHLGWKYTTGFPLDSNLVLADLDGDGAEEILTTSYGFLFIWHNDGTAYVENADSVGLIIYDGDTVFFPIPSAQTFDTTTTSPAVGDIDGDGEPEIVLGDENGNLWALGNSPDGDYLPILPGYPINLGAPISRAPVLADINGDGAEEIIVGTDDGKFFVYSGGAPLWSYDTRGEFVGAVCLPDGRIVAVTQQALGRIFVFSPTGELLVEKDLPSGALNPPAVAITPTETLIVFTSQGVPENSGATVSTAAGKPVPAGEPAGELFVITADGELLPNFPVELYNKASAPVLAEGVHLSGAPDEEIADKNFEIVFTAETLLCCYHINGAPCENFPVVLYEDTFSSAPIIADFDGDGEADIIAVSENSRLYGINFGGEVIGNYPLAVGNCNASPAAMLEGDSLSIVVPSFDGALYVWKGFGWTSPDNWRQFGLYPGNNRVWEYHPQSQSSGEQTGIVEFYNYPNPVAENTYFRYTVSKAGTAEIRIFDETGNEIASLSGEAHPGIPNEILWTPSGVSSGVYMAVLKLKFADGGTATKKQAIAVLKK